MHIIAAVFRQMRTAPWSSANPLAVKGGSGRVVATGSRETAHLPASIMSARKTKG
ncbi:hypothetical protein ACVXHB_02495 [Escherichia coli]